MYCTEGTVYVAFRPDNKHWLYSWTAWTDWSK